MSRNGRIILAAGVCISFMLAVGGCEIEIGGCSLDARHERTEHLSAALGPGSTLDAETDVGAIVVTGADVNSCDVTAEICLKAGSEEKVNELAEQVKVKLEQVGDKLVLKVVKPPKRFKRSISVDFDITVPRETNLELESDVGRIRVSEITGRVKGKTDVGEIVCKRVTGKVVFRTNVGEINCEDVSGDIRLKTDVGKIKARYAEDAPGVFDAELVTDVGGIVFVGPAGMSVEVEASTDIGSIKTELPITVSGKISTKRLEGVIGKGEGRLRLKTDIGSIRIK